MDALGVKSELQLLYLYDNVPVTMSIAFSAIRNFADLRKKSQLLTKKRYNLAPVLSRCKFKSMIGGITKE